MCHLKQKHVFTSVQRPELIFVISGPGAGKGTQCSLLARKYSFRHLSLSNILRVEAATPGSKWGNIIKRNMQEGSVGFKEMTVELLQNAIKSTLEIRTAKYVLIDGKTD